MKTMIPFLEVANLGYFNFRDGVCNHRRGCYYWLDKISQEKKAELEEKYNNIVFLTSRTEYAPEIKHPVIFVADVPFDKPFESLRPKKGVVFVAKFWDGCRMYSVTSLDRDEANTTYYGTKKEAEKFIRKNFSGLEKQIRLNDLACA